MVAQGSRTSPKASKDPPFTLGKSGRLDATTVARLVAASGDVVMLIDQNGVIRDIALNSDDLAREGARSWLGQRWPDTVTIDSRQKAIDLLRHAMRDGLTPWREINQVTPGANAMMMRYRAVDGGRDGHVIAVGCDDRATAAVQMRLLETQQTMERDYARLRDAEFRYRLLFQTSDEAVIVADPVSKRIVEANPAAERLTGVAGVKLVGEPLARIFDADSREAAASILLGAELATASSRAGSPLAIGGRDVMASASLFREGRVSLCLVRLAPAVPDRLDPGEVERSRQALLDRLPEAFVVTDDALKILAVNAGFLEMARLPSRERAIGRSLNDLLGRARLERNILLDTLREHGSVRNFSTVLRNELDESEDVEVSALAGTADAEVTYSFIIRGARRPRPDRVGADPESRRSIEQLTRLVGRVKLKDLVRESSDIVEKLCIEAALELTKNNRASAAGLLGVSRQSLYSKLHRFGLGNLGADGD